jgi:hypothetical protein
MDEYKTDEITLASAVVPALRQGMLCLADRFPSHNSHSVRYDRCNHSCRSEGLGKSRSARLHRGNITTHGMVISVEDDTAIPATRWLIADR